jgi:hypothetical protein
VLAAVRLIDFFSTMGSRPGGPPLLWSQAVYGSPSHSGSHTSSADASPLTGASIDALHEELCAAYARRDELKLAGWRQLQAAWGCAVPVLWISGETAPDGLRAALPPQATVLTKPVSPARLRAWLEQRLQEPDAADPSEPSEPIDPAEPDPVKVPP